MIRAISKILGLSLLFFATGLISCGNSSGKSSIIEDESEENVIQAPDFNADSAYVYIEEQVKFGPRVPNSEAHKKCAAHLVSELERFGAKVTVQEADLVAYDGTILKSTNIVGSYNLDAKKRVMLCSHWDSRPYADQDDEKYHHTAIDGANDGASGVGVLLEIARQLQLQMTEIGIDIIFFDSEDYGAPEFYDGRHKAEYWCLGSQYWGRIPHTSDYKARYGVLLDMVGGKDAKFFYEGYSSRTAYRPMKKIWKAAGKLGFSQLFIQMDGGEVTDDHVFVNKLRQFPCVDIIDYDPDSDTGFNEHWHTLGDNMSNIYKPTLKAVGQTLMQVIYNER